MKPVENIDTVQTEFRLSSSRLKNIDVQPRLYEGLDAIGILCRIKEMEHFPYACAGLSDLYYYCLQRQWIKARRGWSCRNVLSFQSHSFVEVFFNDKWVIFDPTM